MFDQPLLTPINNKEYFLVNDFMYQWQYGGETYRVCIHKGFITDGASIPRWCWSLAGLTPDGLYRAAAVVHDFFYQFRGSPPIGQYLKLVEGLWVETTALTRKECDDLFLRIMVEAGVDSWKAKTMYRAVRIFGAFAW